MPNLPSINLVVAVLLLIANAGCTNLPTEAEVDAAGGDDAYWRDTYERQCLRNTAIQPGSPALVKCVEDLMDIRAENLRREVERP